MALTRLLSENFEGAGVIDSGSPGEFSYVTGAFQKVGVGARISGVAAPGWSAEPRMSGSTNYLADFDMTGGAGAAATLLGQFGFWFRCKALPSSNVGIMRLVRGDAPANPIADISLLSSGKLRNQNSYTGGGDDDITSIPAMEVGKWYWISLAWQVVGFSYNLRVHVMELGGALTLWITADGLTTFAAAFDRVGLAGKNPGGDYTYRASMPTLCSLGSLADIAYPSDVIPPSETPQTWYVNPDAGDDANDGMTALTAWQTAAKLSDESRWMGLMDNYTTAGPGGGDVVRIDTTGAPLEPGTSPLKIQTRGVEILPITGEDHFDVQAHKVLLAGGWSASGTANVYQSADTQANIVVWEDDKWLNHPIGANFAAVAASMTATPGSFWTDGTTLYLHPFGSTNPASDGKVYTRSINRGGGLAAVDMATSRYLLAGLQTGKTCLAKFDDNDALGAYCLQHSGTSTAGTSKISNCVLHYGSKHLFGSTDGSTNSTLIIEDVSAEQGSPYTGFGGQTPFVSYNGVTDGGNHHIYRRCSNLKSAGLIGSTEGEVNTDFPAFIAHANTEDQYPFATLTLEDCVFNTLITPGEALVCTITGGSIQDVTNYCPVLVLDRVNIHGQGLTVSTPTELGPVLTVTNCVIKPVWDIDAAPMYGFQVKGTAVFQGNTIDFSAITGAAAYSNLIERTAALNLTFRDNLVLADETKDWPILGTATSTDTLIFDHNAYVGTPLLARDYNDGTTTANRTLEQWQSLGKDLDALALADAEVDADLFPEAGSPLLGAGTNRGRTEDFSGNTFLERSSIGALELETNPAAADALVWTATWPSQEVTQYERYYDLDLEEWVEAVETFTGSSPNPPVNGRAYAAVRVVSGTRDLTYFQS